MDTIFAVSSGRPPAAIAVLRISGVQAFAAARALCGSLPGQRRAALRDVRDGHGGLLDRALVLTFAAPNTATGEDVVELHCHGGRAVVVAVETALAAMSGLRRAEPGEFTRRALVNGRIDLIEAQGLADLLAAETEAQRRAAIGAAGGAISGVIGDWMTRIADLSARTEALIDFAEEADVDDDPFHVSRLVGDVQGMARAMHEAVAGPSVDRMRDGIGVVLAGPPNSGKSSLLNLLVRRDVAIVSDIAGTTRDRIEIDVSRSGIPYRLTDTAGLAVATDDVVERIGIARAEAAIDAADILVWLGDTSPPRSDAIWLYPRADLPERRTIPEGRRLAVARSRPESIEAAWHAIERQALALVPRTDGLMLAAEQQRTCRAAAAELDMIGSDDLIVIAEHLRRAHRMLGRLLGIDATDAMLDALFSRFCLGK